MILCLFCGTLVFVFPAYASSVISFNLSKAESGNEIVYTLTEINIAAPAAGYFSVNIQYPGVMSVNHSAGQGWDVTADDSGSVAFILSGTTGATASNIKNLLSSITFTVEKEKLSSDAAITISVSERAIAALNISGKMHYYEFIEANEILWSDAYNKAKGKRYSGLSGYLATITSQDEQDFIYDSIAKKAGWLGGTRALLVQANTSFIEIADVDDIPTVSSNLVGDAPSFVTELVSVYDFEGDMWYWACGPEAGYYFYKGKKAEDSGVPIEDSYSHFSEKEPNNAVDPNTTASYYGPEAFLQFALNKSDEWNDLPLYRSNSDGEYVRGYYVEYGGYDNDVLTLQDAHTVLIKDAAGGNTGGGAVTTPEPEEVPKPKKIIVPATVSVIKAIIKAASEASDAGEKPDTADDQTAPDESGVMDGMNEGPRPGSLYLLNDFSAVDIQKIESQTGNPVKDLLEGNIPVGNFSAVGVRSLLSAILSIIGVAIALLLVFFALRRRSMMDRRGDNISNYENAAEYAAIADKKDIDTGPEFESLARKVFRICAIICGVLVAVVWFLLDDMTLPMVWVNQWTNYVAIVFLIDIVLLALYKISGRVKG